MKASELAKLISESANLEEVAEKLKVAGKTEAGVDITDQRLYEIERDAFGGRVASDIEIYKMAAECRDFRAADQSVLLKYEVHEEYSETNFRSWKKCHCADFGSIQAARNYLERHADSNKRYRIVGIVPTEAVTVRAEVTYG